MPDKPPIPYTNGSKTDPTTNVRAIVAASAERQDTLRDADNKFVMAEIKHLNDMAILRALHNEEIRNLESARLNAIRQVDVAATKTEADRAQGAIQTLAATTQTNAENLRNALNATATTIASQTAGTVAAITERIAALEKSSYEGVGKQRVSDPIMTELLTEVKTLRESRSLVAGKSQGISTLWGIILGAVAGLSTLIGIGATLYAILKP